MDLPWGSVCAIARCFSASKNWPTGHSAFTFSSWQGLKAGASLLMHVARMRAMAFAKPVRSSRAATQASTAVWKITSVAPAGASAATEVRSRREGSSPKSSSPPTFCGIAR